MAPKNEIEMKDMLYTALNYEKGPIAIRYPRGNVYGLPEKEKPEMIPIGKGEVLQKGNDVLIVSVGSMVYPSMEAAKILSRKGINTAVINARFVKPLDEDLLLKESEGKKLIVTVEENAVTGGFGSAFLELMQKNNIKKNIITIGIPDKFIEQGNPDLLKKNLGLTSVDIARSVEKFFSRK